MANVHRNISIRGLTDLLGKTRSGQNISTARRRYDDVPDDNGTELSHSDAMRKAATYARFASRHDLYLDRAAETGLTPYSIALTDWFGAPKVLQIDVDAWTGEVGQTIRVKARDNVSVAAVTVVIRDAQGNVLERGEALQTEAGSAWWHYTTRSRISTTPFPAIEATARDLPGNEGSFTI